jgi:pSer/pThr/pTyr-binding forkhead associated (FHA) protein
MRCPSCGNDNRAGSLFCQHCGTRLQANDAQGAKARCDRCGGENQPNMRFCVHCGNNLQQQADAAPPAAAQAPAQKPASVRPQPQQQPAPTPVSSQPAAQPSGREAAPTPDAEGPICWRCRGVGDRGSEFCKFCGARYSDRASEPAVARTVESAQAGTVRKDDPSRAQASHQIVSIRKDGTDGPAYPLSGEQTDFGRSEGDVQLDEDPYLSPRHFRILRRGGDWFLRDLQSVNGVYVRLSGTEELQSGSMILIGQQVLRFELLEEDELPLGPARSGGCLVFGTPEVPAYARLVQYTTEGVGRDVHYLYRDETVLGRETGDIVFTDDPFLSRRHAVVRFDRAQKRTVLEDLGSSNGTCARLRGEHALSVGDHFRVGRHLFRFDPVGAR